MVKQDEVFFQLQQPSQPAGSRHRSGRLRHACEPADPSGVATSRKALSARDRACDGRLASR
jgi:hypothetical protein